MDADGLPAGEMPGFINGPKGARLLEGLYGPDGLGAARARYLGLVRGASPEAGFPGGGLATGGKLRLFCAPGRTELGGNHTDHNRGRVLAASVQLDAAAAVAKLEGGRVFIRSAGFPDTLVELAGEDGGLGLSPRPEERGTIAALVRGIAAGFAARGARVGGFAANVASDVPQGAGLSSSAMLEVLVAKILDCLYAGGRFSGVELAKIGREAENVFFGKPCGLMDQVACASGGAVAIDFADPETPDVKKIAFDPLAAGFALCVVDTGGSHADLTPDYASVPGEMRAVAGFFGKGFLRELELSEVLAGAAAVRKATGDRALLRAIHFFNENRRVGEMAARLEKLEAAGEGSEKREAMGGFLDLVNESGDSSWELLQNVYSPANPAGQGVSLALAVSREFFRAEGIRAACRVHGGGFAGTIQAYVPLEALGEYSARMDGLFGPGALTVLRIRPVGAVELRPD